jgi:hypothetical protein
MDGQPSKDMGADLRSDHPDLVPGPRRPQRRSIAQIGLRAFVVACLISIAVRSAEDILRLVRSLSSQPQAKDTQAPQAKAGSSEQLPLL